MSLDLTPVPAGIDTQVNTTTANAQVHPSLAALKDGGFVVTWWSLEQDGDGFGIYGQRYDETGAAVGPEFRINTETAGNQIESSVTALADGGFVVTWTSGGDQDGEGNGIYGQRYDAAGAPVGGEFQINTTTASDQRHPSVTALADGGFVVTWSSEVPDSDDNDIYGRRYDATGATVGGEFRINTTTTDGQINSTVAALGDGGFVVTWTSDGQDGSRNIYGQRYDETGAAVGGEFQINTETASEQDESSVAALNGGGFVVTWTSEGQDSSLGGIYAQRYDATGAPVGPEFRVNTETASAQSSSSVTALGDGGFVVTWTSFGQDGDGGGVYGQRYDANGIAVGNEFRLNSITAGEQSNGSDWGSEWLATLADGRLAATWSGFGDEEVFVRLIDVPFNPTPVPTGSDIQVNTETAGLQIHSSVTALGDGGFVVIWASLDQDGSGQGIYGQRYDANGIAVGNEFKVNTTTASEQRLSSVAALADGGFVVTWSSLGQDGSGYGIYGQRYDANGIAVGNEFKVNTTTAANQVYSSVTALGDGGFVVTWSSFNQDGNGWGIYGQRYDVNGIAVGNEFKVNTTTASDQIYSSMTALGDGGFVVTWTSGPQDGNGTVIYGQRYDANGIAVGNEFKVNTSPAASQQHSSVTALGDGGFVVTWSSLGPDGSGWGIYGQRYDANGIAVGNEFKVNTTTASDQRYPSVTALGDGGFVVTWSSSGQDGSGQGIYGQRYDANGIAVGNEFRLNDITAGDQVNNSFWGSEWLATLADGRLVATWSGFGIGEVFVRLVDVPSPNTAPSSAGGTVSTAEDTGYVFTTTDFNFTDSDAGDTLQSVTILSLPAEGTLLFDASGGAPDDATPVAVNDVIDAADIAAGKLIFVPDADESGAAYASFDYAVSDGTDVSAPATMTIDVNAVNDAPALTGDLAANVDEGGSYQIGASDLGFADPDDAAADVTFTVSNLVNGTVLVNGVAQATFTGQDLADGLVAFQHDGSETLAASFDVAVEDGDEDGSAPGAQTFNLTVNPVNDPPALTGDLAANVDEGGSYQIGAADLGFADPDDAAADVTFTVSNLVNGTVLVNGVAQATFTGQDLADGLVAFQHDGSETLAASFDVAVEDGDEDGSAPGVQTFNLTVNPVNDPPALTGDLAANVDEGGSYQIGAADLGFADPDDAAADVTFTVSNLVNGTVLVNGVAQATFTGQDLADGLVAFQHDGSETLAASFDVAVEDGDEDGSAPVVQTFNLTVNPVNDPPVAAPVNLGAMDEDGTRLITEAELLAGVTDVDGPATEIIALSIQAGFGGSLINNFDGTWTYTAAPDDDTEVAFTYTAWDGLQAVSSTATLDITPVNDPPVATPVDLGAMDEDGTRLITEAELLAGVTDVDGPATEVIALSIQAGFGGSLINNFDGTWTYTAAPDDDTEVAFTYTAWDGSQAVSSTATLDITPVNDAPVLTGDLAASVDEGGSYQIGPADLGFTDLDDTAADVTFTVSNLVNGTVLVNGVAQATFTGQDIADGLVTFQHDGSETLAASFDVAVDDGDEDGSASVAQTFSLTVTPVSDAPVNTVPGAQVTPWKVPLVFSNANGNAIMVGDDDSDPLTVTLAVDHGTLTLSTLDGLTVEAGANGSGTITVSGTQTALNAALDGLTYQTSLTTAGSDELTIVSSDGDLNDSDIVEVAMANSVTIIRGGNEIDTYGSIQEAIDNAISGDLVQIENGTYAENVTLKSGVSLQGESEAGVILSGTLSTPASLADVTVTNMTVNNVGDTMLLDMRGTLSVTDVVFEHVTFSQTANVNGAIVLGNGQVSGTMQIIDGDGDDAGLTFRDVTMASNNHVAGTTAFVYTLVESVDGARMVVDNVTLSGTASGVAGAGLGAQWNMSPPDTVTSASVDIINSQTSGGGNFYVSGFDGVTIQNNVFDGQGIALNGVKNTVVEGNTFQNISNAIWANEINPGPTNQHRGLVIEDAWGTTGVSNLTVTGNTFDNITSVDGTIAFQRFNGGNPPDTATVDRLNDVVIQDNIFTNLGGGVSPIFVNDTYFGAGAVIPATIDGQQLIIGSDGDDVIVDGSSAATSIFSSDGDDTITGGAGDDAIDGGDGLDTAVYADDLDAGDIAPTSSWDVSTATEGTDTLTNVEIVQDSGGQRFLLVGSDGFATIQAALAEAQDGDTILVAPGTYDEDLTIDVAVTILGAHAGVAGTDGARDAANGVGETTIIGRSKITAAGNVTIDGVRFLNDGTTTGGGPSNSTLQVLSGHDHVITNSIFYSAVNGAANGVDDRAISFPVIGAGDVEISGNYFTGAFASGFSGGSWGRGIWFDGGGINVTIEGNTFEFTRTGINADMTGTSAAAIENNTFITNGTATSIGVNLDNVTFTDNSYEGTFTEFNFRNLTTDIDFDGAAAVASVTPSGAPEVDAVEILGGEGNDTLRGTEGTDFIDDNAGGAAFESSTVADNDILDGRGGDDVLVAEFGDDTLIGGTGDDVLFGGEGTDTAVFGVDVQASDISVVADADPFTAGEQAGWQVSAGAEGTDTLNDIEVIDDLTGGNVLLVGAGGFDTLQEAIDAASEGDTILVAAGSYAGATIDKPVTIIGRGNGSDPDSDTIFTSGFTVDLDSDSVLGTVSFQNLAIVGSAGAGINAGNDQEVLGTLSLENVRIEDSASHGLIVSGRKQSTAYNQAGVQNVVITDSQFIDNGQSSSNVANLMFFEFDGDATLTNVEASNVVQGANSAAFGVQFAGFDGPLYDQLTPDGGSSVGSYDVLTPMGNVTIDGLSVTGVTRKASFYVQGYTDLSGLSITNSTVDTLSGWGKPVIIDPMADQFPDGEPNTPDNAGSFFDDSAADGSYDLSGLTVVQNGLSQFSELDGTVAADTIVGTDANDQIRGFDGNDSLDGADGDDVLIGEGGDDTLEGGVGHDAAVYEGTLADYNVGVVTDGNGFVTAFTSVEETNVTGTDEGADTLNGVEQLIFLNGTPGNFADDSVLDLDHAVQLFKEDVLIGTFETLKDAVDAVNARADDDFTIRLASGDVHMNGQVVINKNVTIEGAGNDQTLLKADFSTSGNHNDDSGALIVVNAGVEANFTGFRIDGKDHQVTMAIRHHGTGTVDSVHFANINFTTNVGTGISVRGDGDVDVINSVFTNIGRIGAHFRDAGVVGLFENNDYTGKGAGVHLEYAAEAGGGADVVFRGNTVRDNLGEVNADDTSAGFLVTTFFGPGTTATFENNTVVNSFEGVAIGYPAGTEDTSDVTFLGGNDFAGNDTDGLVGTGVTVVGNSTVTGTNLVNGTFHWEGGTADNQPSGAGLEDQLNGGGGEDTLTGFAGDDTLDGGDGIDTAMFADDLDVADIAPTSSWDVTTATEGTDTLTNVEIVQDGEGQRFLLVGSDGFDSIQAAINAAEDGDTILVAAGTYAESLTVDKQVTIQAVEPGVILQGTLLTDLGVPDDMPLNDFFEDNNPNYSATTGISISADNVTISGLTITGFAVGAELNTSNGVSLLNNTFIDNVTGIRKGTAQEVTGLTVNSNVFTQGIHGMTIYAAVGAGSFDGITMNDNDFSALSEKGMYFEQLSNAEFNGNEFDDVGNFGRISPPFGGTQGEFGQAIDINLKHGTYGNVVFNDTTITNSGHSNQDGAAASGLFGSAIGIKTRDDAPSYNTVPADFTGQIVFDGLVIDGTSTGVRVGEPGKNNLGPDVLLTDVTITDATVGDVDNATHATLGGTTTVVLSEAQADLDASASQAPVHVTGNDLANVINGGAGNDVINGNGGDDTINGGAGNDVVNGGEGNDTLDGGAGVDIIDGGDGDDIIIANAGNDTNIGGAGTDTYSLINAGTGGGFADLNSGFAFSSNTGLDSLSGIENLRGSSGADALLGDANDNVFFATGGIDTIDGRGGVDTYDASGAVLTGVVIDLEANTVSGHYNGTLTSIENAVGTDFFDTFIGQAGEDNVFDGGASIDTAQYSGDLSAVDIAPTGSWQVTTGSGDTDTLTNVEIVVDGDGQRFLLVGSDGFDSIQTAVDLAQAGDTILVAEGTYDGNLVVDKALTFIAKGDVDLVSTAGNGVTLTSGIGGSVSFDGFDFIGSGSADTGILVSTGADAMLTLSNGSISGFTNRGIFSTDAGDPIANPTLASLAVSNFAFSNNGNGGGNTADVKLYGFAGSASFLAVTFTGGDILGALAELPDSAIEITGSLANAGSAHPVPLDSPNADITLTDVTVTGGYHKNPVALFHFDSVDGVTITGLDLSGAASNWGPLFNIDGIKDGTIDASAFDITFPATDAIHAEIQGEEDNQGTIDSTITGTAGNDSVHGKGGDDTLNGGDGDDALYGGNKPGEPFDDGAGDDTLNGGAGDDFLSGGIGDDTLTGGTGDDTLDGGDGIDTAMYADDLDVADIAPTSSWDVTTTTEGTDTLTGVEIVQDGEGQRFLLVGSDGFDSIQAAINAAEDGDTILVAAGTYAESLTVDKQVTIQAVEPGVILQGTLLTDLGVPDDMPLNDFFEANHPAYSHSAGLTITADNVSVSGLTITGFAAGVVLDSSDNVSITGNVFVDNVRALLNDAAFDGLPDTITNLIFSDNNVSQGVHGIVITAINAPGSMFDGITMDDNDFSALSEKGMYFEMLSHASLSRNTFDDVGNYGRISPPFGGTDGAFGSALELNLKFVEYTDVTFTDTLITNSGMSNKNDPFGVIPATANAVSVKLRDDNGGTVGFDGTVVFNNLSIDGTSTGVRVGEPAKSNIGPDVEINGLSIANAQVTDVDNATHPTDGGTVTVTLADGQADFDASLSQAPVNVTGNDLANAIVGGTGDDIIDGAGGDDTLDGGDGNDTVAFGDDWSAYTITRVGNTYTVVGNGQTDTAANFENFSFNGNVVDVTGDPDVIVSTIAPTIISIVEEDDEDANPATISVDETAAVGTVVATVTADDINLPAGDELTFSLRTGSNTPFVGPLEIVKTSNTTAQIRVSGALNFELVTSYAFFVHVTDLAGNDVAQGQPVFVLDGNDPPVPATLGTDRQMELGSTEFQIGLLDAEVAADPDGDSLTYTVVTLPTAGTVLLNGQAVTVGQELTEAEVKALTYTAPVNDPGPGVESYTLQLTFSDGVNPPVGPITINLNVTDAQNGNHVGTLGADRLDGAAGNDIIQGLGGDDTLLGGVGNDQVDGGDGNDRMIMATGDGNDVFVGGAGFDTLDYSGVGGAVQVNLLSGTTSGAAGNDTLTDSFEEVIGSSFNDVLIGNAAANTLDGGAGNDNMSGGAGNDMYRVDSSGDVIVENLGEGNDTVLAAFHFVLPGNVENLTLVGTANLQAYGNNLANTLLGNSGNNILNGNAGADFMAGSTGNDTYFVDNGGDVVNENAGEGIDVVLSTVHYNLAANVETLRLLGTDDLQGYGNELANVIHGNAGNNLLNGRAGADSMFGGAGNDVYFVDNAGDVVFENAGEGTDTVRSTVHYTLSANVEHLVLQGTDNLQGYGNALANAIYGNAGNNILNGNAGADSMFGGAGNDVYFVDHAGDVVVENAGEGTDAVFASTHYRLTANVETLVLQGSADLQAYGNAQANTLHGNSGRNILEGGAGADVLAGHDGNDFFIFYAGQADGDTVVDFTGNGAAAGDMLLFFDYGPGATFTQVDATHWEILYDGGTQSELITFQNAAAIHLTDYAFM